MEVVHHVLPVASLLGKLVLSMETGNKLGAVKDVFIDPINGVVVGLTVEEAGAVTGLPYNAIYSFGHDAIMAVSEGSLRPIDGCSFLGYPRPGDLTGTTLITVGGNVLGQIRNVLVTLQSAPIVVYSIGESLLDRLLGREWYILASDAHALSDDTARLVVPDHTALNIGKSIEELLDPAFAASSFDRGAPRADTRDDTRVILRDLETETVLRSDDDDTVIRLRPDLAA